MAPAPCRASYSDPPVIDHFDRGEAIADLGWPGPASTAEQLRAAAERALLSLLADGTVLAA